MGEDIVKLFLAGYNVSSKPNEVLLTQRLMRSVMVLTCAPILNVVSGHLPTLPRRLVYQSLVQVFWPRRGLLKGYYALKLRSLTQTKGPWDWLKKLIDLLANKHEPIFDIDGDLFSPGKLFTDFITNLLKSLASVDQLGVDAIAMTFHPPFILEKSKTEKLGALIKIATESL